MFFSMKCKQTRNGKMSKNEIPLSLLKDGDIALVAAVNGGRAFSRRLAELGIHAGGLLKVIKGGGPVILDVKGQRLVIGRGMAHKVMVKEHKTPGKD